MLLAEKSTWYGQQETRKSQNHGLHLSQLVTYLDDRGCHQRGKHAAVNGRAHVPRLHCGYKLMQRGLNRVQELRRKHNVSSVVREQALPGSRSVLPFFPPPPASPTSGAACPPRLSFRLLTHIAKPTTRRRQTGQKPTCNYLPAIVCPKAEEKPPRTKVSIISIEKKERKGEESEIESNISDVLNEAAQPMVKGW